MISYILIVVGASLIASAGVLIWKDKRQKAKEEQQQRDRELKEFLEAQRKRMAENRGEFMKEIEQIAKQRHPDSNRHQRRAVAARYGSKVKSS